MSASKNYLEGLKSAGILAGDNILAIDYGIKRVGLATFRVDNDPYPLVYGKINVKNEPQLIQELTSIISGENIACIVLGIPRLTDGQLTNMSKKIMQFGQKLKELFPSTLYFEQDETLSSFEAEDRMKNSARYNFKINREELDALAASIILEDFLKNFTSRIKIES